MLEKKLSSPAEQKRHLHDIIDKKIKGKIRIKEEKYRGACKRLAVIYEKEKNYPAAVFAYNQGGFREEALRVYNKKMQSKK